MGLARFAWEWFRRQIVEDVPEGDAVCEFDCRKLQCRAGEWETCERRLQHAAGELMPPPKLSSGPRLPEVVRETGSPGRPDGGVDSRVPQRVPER